MNGAYQRLLCVDVVNILGGSERTVKKNAEVFVVDSKGTELEVIAYRTKYMVMSGDQIAG